MILRNKETTSIHVLPNSNFEESDAVEFKYTVVDESVDKTKLLQYLWNMGQAKWHSHRSQERS